MATSTNLGSVDVAVTSEQVVASEPPLTAESSKPSEQVVASEQPLTAESSKTSEQVVASEQPLTAKSSKTSEPAETFDSAISKPAVISISHDSEKADAAELEKSIEETNYASDHESVKQHVLSQWMHTLHVPSV